MIHKFKQNGVNVLIDVNSGGIHVIDDIVYDIVDFCENNTDKEVIENFCGVYSKEELFEALEEIRSLQKEEMLFSIDDYEKILPSMDVRNPVVKALCLHIAHDCNLKCVYCFAEEGEYHGKRALMSLDVGRKALDFLVKNSGNRKNLEIDFFGGEPLMNFDVVKEIVEYGHELELSNDKKFRFTMTTNGVLLDPDKLEFINEHMHNLVLSLDGRKELNDRMRPRAGGLGSYDVIVPNLQKAADSRNQTNYFLRGTFTRENLDFSEDVLHIAELGFKQISVEPVVGTSDMPYAIRIEDLPRIYEEYDKLAKIIYEKRKDKTDFNFFHFNIDLTGGPCVMKRLAGCGSGSEYLAVTPEGDLYPCHQFVGMEEFKMGTVDSGITDENRREEFSKCNVYAKEECKNCWAKFYCSGGCAANALKLSGDMLTPYKIGCDLAKKRIECALMIKAKEFEEANLL